MKFRVHTQSGSIYIIDNSNLTWERNNPMIGIMGYDKSDGSLSAPATITVGEKMYLPIVDRLGNSVIRTTMVTEATII